ncbi:hypothetical protein CEXT_82291 [Caerostris extrusa]|uniref:Uncharacterized protein n=1 Tax=Caerostris extrusa TaxID=172846 RepID=A0AAV4TPE2_CAEEX|nr:hypothetical protein CEXT_82291 [Caerostris extrusa]
MSVRLEKPSVGPLSYRVRSQNVLGDHRFKQLIMASQPTPLMGVLDHKSLAIDVEELKMLSGVHHELRLHPLKEKEDYTFQEGFAQFSMLN